ncbi:hypothetical protein ACLKA6_013997 [Drosophila palustris]
MKLTTRLGFDQKGSSFLTGFTTLPPPCFSRNAIMSRVLDYCIKIKKIIAGRTISDTFDLTPTATRL